MFRKHFILFGILLATTFLVVSTWYYPGGSQHDLNSPGYDWKNNYLCDLFSPKAMNGRDNLSRTWAVGGMLILCISLALFFIDFSKKIPVKSGARIIKYAGAGSMSFAFLTVTAYHDLMVTLANTLALVGLFYITVFIFRSKLNSLKILSVACILIAYACTYVYYSRQYLEFLPVLQKIDFIFIVVWFLSLVYFTKPADFAALKN